MLSSLCVPPPALPSLTEGLLPSGGWSGRRWCGGGRRGWDHTAPGRQPLSSNPLSDVMTLSNLDHLLKHVPGAVSAAALVSRAPPLPLLLALPNHEPAAGWLLAARRQGQGHSSAAERETHTHARTQARTHRNSTRRERENPPSHRNLRGRSRRKGQRERESERSGEGRNGRGRERG